MRTDQCIKTSFHPTIAHYFRASRAAFHNSYAAVVFYMVFLIAPVLGSLICLWLGVDVTTSVVGGLPLWFCVILLAAYPLVLHPASQFLHLSNAYKANERARQEKHFDLSPAGVNLREGGERYSVQWNSLARIIESRAYLLFFSSTGLSFYIPKEHLSEKELEQVRSWIQET